MPAILDKERKTWIAQFYYTNYKGERKRKRKRGFKRKKDALQYEYDFLAEHQYDISMTFKRFSQVYLEDIRHRVRESTYQIKQFIFKNKLVPFFGEMRMSEIQPKDIRDWQNEQISYRSEDGEEYAQTYLHSLCAQLSAIFNYAVKYYDLPANPCHKAGHIGSSKCDEMQFWTPEEFNKFMDTLGDYNYSHTMAFKLLYYTGLRIGELLALTPNDFDRENVLIKVTKTYRRDHKRDVISEPKTKKSNRKVTLPNKLAKELADYIDSLGEVVIKENTRIFPFTPSALTYTMRIMSKAAGVKRIRLHDFRHSHASLLIEMGCEPTVVADRLGHENIETTLNIYSHLNSKRRTEVAEKLNEFLDD